MKGKVSLVIGLMSKLGLRGCDYRVRVRVRFLRFSVKV